MGLLVKGVWDVREPTALAAFGENAKRLASIWSIVDRREDSFYMEGDVRSLVSHNFLIDTGAQTSLISCIEKLSRIATGKSITFSGVVGRIKSD